MSVVSRPIPLGKLLAVLKGAAILTFKAKSAGWLGRISGKLILKNKGEFIIGKNVSFHAKPFPSSIAVGKGAKLEVGDSVFFNYGLDIGCTQSIRIGSHTIIGPMVNIMDSNYHPVDGDDESGSKDIIISDNVWVGRGAVILPGVTIGSNSMVAAGSIVTRDIPANVLAGGTPARVIRKLRIPEGWIRRYSVGAD